MRYIHVCAHLHIGAHTSHCISTLSFGLYVQVYAAVRLIVSSNGSADVNSILTEADTSLASKLVVSDPVKAGKSFTARLTGGRRKTGTSTPDASFTPRPSISHR